MIVVKEGKMIAKVIVVDEKNANVEAAKKLIEVEQELNYNVANDIYRKFGVGVRFHA